MDTLIIYLIIGIIWVVQVIVKKKQEEERRRKPENYEPAKKKDLFDELKEVLEKKYLPPSEQEVILQKAEPVEEQETDETEINEEEQIPEFEQEKADEIPVEPVPVQSQAREDLLKKIFNNYKPGLISSQPQVETPPAPYFLRDLSGDTLEQGIILSAILGPPKSVQLFKMLAGRNLRWKN